MPMPTIEPVLFADPPLHGVYYAPCGERRASVLMLSPLFEEKRCAARVMLTCAQELAQAGTAVFQPDLYATGNSAGRLSDVDLARWLSDVRNATAWLRQRAGGPLYLLGCRAGALLAAHAAARGISIDRLILWQPVVSGRGYLGQLRTRRMVQEKLTGEEPVEVGKHEVEGQELSPEFYSEFEQLTLPAPPLDSEVRLLQCSFNEKLTRANMTGCSRVGDPSACVCAASSASHSGTRTPRAPTASWRWRSPRRCCHE